MIMMMNNFIGRYKLITHGIYLSENTFRPTSDYLKGELIYSSEGFLSVQIFFKENIDGPRDLLTYSGRYNIISENIIEHHIEICSQAKRDNTIEKREYKFIDNILFLSIQYEDNSKFEAKWEKI